MAYYPDRTAQRPSTTQPRGLRLRGVVHTPRKYHIKKVRTGPTSSGLLHTERRKGGKGLSDARHIHDSQAKKARDARKLRTRVEKHAQAMLLAIEKQEHDLDSSSFKAKHMNLEQEMEMLISKTAHMDVTAWSKKMLEEAKNEVRELKEELAVLQNKRLKIESELHSTELSLENVETRAKMLGLGAYEGTHEVDIKTKHLLKEKAEIGGEYNIVAGYTGVLRLLKERAKLSIGDLPVKQKFLIEEINMYKHELHSAQMQKLHAVRESNKEENLYIELEKTAEELQVMQEKKLIHLREIYAAEGKRRERNQVRRIEALAFAQSIKLKDVSEEELDHLYEQYQQGTVRIAALNLKLKQLQEQNKDLIEGFELMEQHANVRNTAEIVHKFLNQEANFAEFSKTRDEKNEILQRLRAENKRWTGLHKSAIVEKDTQEAYKHRRQRLDQEKAEMDNYIQTRQLEDSTRRSTNLLLLSNGLDDMLYRCVKNLDSCLLESVERAKSKESKTSLSGSLGNRRGSTLKGVGKGVMGVFQWKQQEEKGETKKAPKSLTGSTGLRREGTLKGVGKGIISMFQWQKLDKQQGNTGNAEGKNTDDDDSSSDDSDDAKQQAPLRKRSVSQQFSRKGSTFRGMGKGVLSAVSWGDKKGIGGGSREANGPPGSPQPKSRKAPSKSRMAYLRKQSTFRGMGKGVFSAVLWGNEKQIKSKKPAQKPEEEILFDRMVQKIELVLASVKQIKNEVLEQNIPEKEKNEVDIFQAHRKFAKELATFQSLSASAGKANVGEEDKKTDKEVKTRRLSTRMMGTMNSHIASKLNSKDNVPAGASLYSLLCLDNNHLHNQDLRVTAKVGPESDSHDDGAHEMSESDSDAGARFDDQPEWVKHVTDNLVLHEEEEDEMDQLAELTDSGNLPDRPPHGHRKNKRKRTSSIVIEGVFPPVKPTDGNEEKVVTRQHIKHQTKVALKQNRLALLNAAVPKSKGEEKDPDGHSHTSNRPRTLSSSSRGQPDDLSMLNSSWVTHKKEELIKDAGVFLDDLHKEMELKEIIMKSRKTEENKWNKRRASALIDINGQMPTKPSPERGKTKLSGPSPLARRRSTKIFKRRQTRRHTRMKHMGKSRRMSQTSKGKIMHKSPNRRSPKQASVRVPETVKPNNFSKTN